MAKSFTKDSFMQLWQKELLPSIGELIKNENREIHDKIKGLNSRFEKVEQSQQFLSTKYDELLVSLQSTKRLIEDQGNQLSDATSEVGNIRESTYRHDIEIDELQQYMRRDCLEITGSSLQPDQNTNEYVIELASSIGVDLAKDDISTAHRLPETKKVKDRLIVKFTRRDKREEMYKKRSNLKDRRQHGDRSQRIHINESLTAYRKRLFGKINQFKKDHKYKYLWTINGKIHLRETDNMRVNTFTTFEQFESYQDSILLKTKR